MQIFVPELVGIVLLPVVYKAPMPARLAAFWKVAPVGSLAATTPGRRDDGAEKLVAGDGDGRHAGSVLG